VPYLCPTKFFCPASLLFVAGMKKAAVIADCGFYVNAEVLTLLGCKRLLLRVSIVFASLRV
jgi:hypothetical protein